MILIEDQKTCVSEARGSRRLPLTLTLSPAERGQPLDVLIEFASHRAASSRAFATHKKRCHFAKALGAFLPLRPPAALVREHGGSDGGERAGVR